MQDLTLRFGARAAAALCLALSIGSANATLIVDTGEPGPLGSAYALQGGNGWHQYLAGKFTVADSYKIASVSTHLQHFTPYWTGGGTFNFKLYADNGGLSGNALYASAELTVPDNAAGAWYTANDLGWNIGAGSYWMAIEAEQSWISVLATGAATSMEDVSVKNPYLGQWTKNGPGLSPSMRIDADAATVPEPATLGLSALALAGVAAISRRRKAG